MYKANITQDVQPAMADPSYLQQAARLQGEASKLRSSATATMIGAVQQGIEMKTAMDMRQIAESGGALLDEFTTSSMAAEQAGKVLPKVNSLIEFDENVGPLRGEDVAMLDSLKGQATKLRNAMQGGMSNVQYEARVADLTRKSIARYPGMADKIRQILGAATGLPGADRWAASQYVQERFSPKAASGPSAMVKKDFDLIVKYNPDFSYEELETMRSVNDPRYFSARERALEKANLEAVNNFTDQTIKNTVNEGAAAVPELRTNGLGKFEGQLSTDLIGAYEQAVSQGAFNAYLQQVQSGKVNAEELLASSQMHTTRMLRAAEEAYAKTKNELQREGTRLGLNKEQMAEVLSPLDSRLEEEKRLWGDKNSFVAQALVEKNFADATFDKKFKMMQATSGLLQFLPRNTVDAYFTNPSVLKASNPELFSLIDGSIKMADSARSGVLNSLDTSRRNITFTVEQAGETGVVTPPANAPEADVKTVHQAVASQVNAAVDKINAGGEVSVQDVNYLKGLLTGVSPTGGAVTVTDGVQRIRNTYEKLEEGSKNVVKEAASTGSVTAISNINTVLDDIERKFGVRVQLGVNDAGEIGVVNLNFRSVRQGRPPVEGETPGLVSDISNFNASKEAVNRLTPMLRNLVNTRLIVEKGDVEQLRSKVAQDYVSVINNKQQYNGFFSLEAKPTPPVEVETPQETETTSDEEVLSMLQSMKEQDEGVNVDYMYNAYLRASPEEKAAIAKKFRDNSAVMSDISGIQ